MPKVMSSPGRSFPLLHLSLGQCCHAPGSRVPASSLSWFPAWVAVGVVWLGRYGMQAGNLQGFCGRWVVQGIPPRHANPSTPPVCSLSKLGGHSPAFPSTQQSQKELEEGQGKSLCS